MKLTQALVAPLDGLAQCSQSFAVGPMQNGSQGCDCQETGDQRDPQHLWRLIQELSSRLAHLRPSLLAGGTITLIQQGKTTTDAGKDVNGRGIEIVSECGAAATDFACLTVAKIASVLGKGFLVKIVEKDPADKGSCELVLAVRGLEAECPQ